jgi:ubiquinone/menaquinone biosynthesis C-methylase UbiE
VRTTMPKHADRIASILRLGPRGMLRGVGRRLRRFAAKIAWPTRVFPAMDTIHQPDAYQGSLRILVKRGSDQCILTPGLFDDFDFQHGDELEVIPAVKAAELIRTPEGNLHVRASDGRGIRVPPRMEFTSFRGYQMPEHLVRLTGAGSDTLERLGADHIANYKKYVGLAAGMSFLEIGSGMGRDAFQLIDILGPSAKYIGIDVQRESIVWCQKNISRDHPNFQFVHFNAVHELHNPLGTKTTRDYSLPAADRSIDRVALQSVLTHIFEEEVVHYLSEISRVLNPDGLAYVTFLLYSEEIVAASRRNNLTAYGLRFEHKYAEGCYVDNARYPTGGVAYTDEAMQRMIKRAGLRLIRPYLKGQWSGYHADADDDGQDVAILGPALAAVAR